MPTHEIRIKAWFCESAFKAIRAGSLNCDATATTDATAASTAAKKTCLNDFPQSHRESLENQQQPLMIDAGYSQVIVK